MIKYDKEYILRELEEMQEKIEGLIELIDAQEENDNDQD